jgi:hypothetical protein
VRIADHYENVKSFLISQTITDFYVPAREYHRTNGSVEFCRCESKAISEQPLPYAVETARVSTYRRSGIRNGFLTAQGNDFAQLLFEISKRQGRVEKVVFLLDCIGDGKHNSIEENYSALT